MLHLYAKLEIKKIISIEQCLSGKGKKNFTTPKDG